jgi:hypothetical protein
MNNLTKTAAIVGGTAGAVLIGQYLYNRFAHPTSSNDSLLSRGVSGISNVVNRATSSCSTVAVRVGYPVVRMGPGGYGTPNVVDGPVNNSTLHGIRIIATDVFGNTNAADLVCALASCESQNGNLVTDCFNCSLFNIHHPGCGASTIITERSPRGKPSVMKGTDKIISFITDEPNQVEGFRSSIMHLKGYLERKSASSGHNFIENLNNRDWNGFQIGLAKIRYGGMYINAVSGNTVRSSFLHARFARLLGAGLVTNDASGSAVIGGGPQTGGNFGSGRQINFTIDP